ncbi:MAG: hypothetical protein JWO06_2793, partial [Bacteroidota bacterium]|nr:hypothetical protein [Bacteroidota bacterium]
MNPQIRPLKKQIRLALLFFMIALVLSGATAMPVEMELNFLLHHLSADGIPYQLF